jgi:hypothetical protein
MLISVRLLGMGDGPTVVSGLLGLLLVGLALTSLRRGGARLNQALFKLASLYMLASMVLILFAR